ncbi:MAG: cytochrome c [Blastocatellia bacterium]|nr:cytochrome c [Blastocatellia bacterium]
MRKRFILGVLAGLMAVLVGAALIAPLVMKLGIVPVNADRRPPAWEARLLGMAVHTSVARRAEERPNPLPPTEENLVAGAEIYMRMCAKRHGRPNGGPSIYGASFYPPAPQLAAHPPQYTEAELFWIVKHGIRNTAMPTWGGQLSDEDIWQVVAILKRLDSLPPAVTAEWKKERHGSVDQ